MSSSQNLEKEFKITLLGDDFVGKSKTVEKFTKPSISFEETTPTTIGASFCRAQVCIDEKKVNLNFWDTNGTDPYKPLTSLYLRGAHGIVLFYDITKKESFKNVHSWLELIRENHEDHTNVR